MRIVRRDEFQLGANESAQGQVVRPSIDRRTSRDNGPKYKRCLRFRPFPASFGPDGGPVRPAAAPESGERAIRRSAPRPEKGGGRSGTRSRPEPATSRRRRPAHPRRRRSRPDGWPMRSDDTPGRASACATLPGTRHPTARHSAPVSGTARCGCPTDMVRARMSIDDAGKIWPDRVGLSCGADSSTTFGMLVIRLASSRSDANPIATAAI